MSRPASQKQYRLLTTARDMNYITEDAYKRGCSCSKEAYEIIGEVIRHLNYLDSQTSVRRGDLGPIIKNTTRYDSHDDSLAEMQADHNMFGGY